jgi:hypothetical protein
MTYFSFVDVIDNLVLFSVVNQEIKKELEKIEKEEKSIKE